MNKTLIYISIITIFLGACSSQQLFMGDYPVGKGMPYSTASAYRHEHQIVPGDQISVSVWNHSELGIGSVYSSQNSNPEFGKWVMIDADGFASLPMIGKVNVGGKTIREATVKLTEVYGHFIESPNLTLKVHNLSLTILGEINSPGSYTLDKQSTHLAKIIGEAGGLTKYADVSTIKIIRGDYTEPTLLMADLSDLGNIKEAYPVLYPGDVIYVPSKKTKAFDEGAQRMVPLIGLISAIALIISVTN